MPDVLQKWQVLPDCGKPDNDRPPGAGPGIQLQTLAMELQTGCLVAVAGYGIVFVPGVRISNAHGVCLAVPDRQTHEDKASTPPGPGSWFGNRDRR